MCGILASFYAKLQKCFEFKPGVSHLPWPQSIITVSLQEPSPGPYWFIVQSKVHKKTQRTSCACACAFSKDSFCLDLTGWCH